MKRLWIFILIYSCVVGAFLLLDELARTVAHQHSRPAWLSLILGSTYGLVAWHVAFRATFARRGPR